MSEKIQSLRMSELTKSAQESIEATAYLVKMGLLPAEYDPFPNLEDMPYEDYLQTPHWKALRAETLRLAGYRCQVCNTKDRALHAHHRTYERRGFERQEDLIALCDKCHTIFHEHGRLSS